MNTTTLYGPVSEGSEYSTMSGSTGSLSDPDTLPTPPVVERSATHRAEIPVSSRSSTVHADSLRTSCLIPEPSAPLPDPDYHFSGYMPEAVLHRYLDRVMEHGHFQWCQYLIPPGNGILKHKAIVTL